MHRKVVAGALAGAMALGAAGCGAEEPLTRAQLVKQAGVICANFDKQSRALLTSAYQRAERSGRTNAFAAVHSDVVAVRQRAIDRLEALKPPTELKDAYTQMTASMQSGLKLFPTASALAAGNDPQAKRRQAQEANTRNLAKRLGLKCS